MRRRGDTFARSDTWPRRFLPIIISPPPHTSSSSPAPYRKSSVYPSQTNNACSNNNSASPYPDKSYSTAISCMGRLSPAACRAATYSEIISSSSRYLSVAGPVMPGRSFSTSLSSPTSLSAYPGTSGRGPTKLLLPMSAFRRLADATRSFFRADGNHAPDAASPRLLLHHCYRNCSTRGYR